MSVLHTQFRLALPQRAEPRLASLYQLSETFRSISAAWEAIASGTWSTSAVQSFATLARRHALELSTLGCGALDQAVVELVLALDAVTVAGAVSPHQVERVDYALANIRAATVQRILALELPAIACAGECAPVLCEEPCARCAASGVCAILWRRPPGAGR
jgi:hypothetical protein